ncbi:hypothetical protein STEG23_020669, partial [Scotinomys teguina]
QLELVVKVRGAKLSQSICCCVCIIGHEVSLKEKSLIVPDTENKTLGVMTRMGTVLKFTMIAEGFLDTGTLPSLE